MCPSIMLGIHSEETSEDGRNEDLAQPLPPALIHCIQNLRRDIIERGLFRGTQFLRVSVVCSGSGQ